MEKISHVCLRLEILIVHLVLGIHIVIIPILVTQGAWELISFSPLERQVQNLISSRDAKRFVDLYLFTPCLRSLRDLISLHCYSQISVTKEPENILFWYFGRYVSSPFLQLFISALQLLYPSHQDAAILLSEMGECAGLTGCPQAKATEGGFF